MRKNKPKAKPAQQSATEKRPKQNTRRVRICLKTFTEYGINFGDTALVAMNPDEVRIGELAYFSIQRDGFSYNQFSFLCESDAACPDWLEKTGICLRRFKNKCHNEHKGEPYGRVCAVERQRQPVEPTLELRPYDERADAFNPTSFKPLNPQTDPPNTVTVKVSGEYENATWYEGAGPSFVAHSIKDGDRFKVRKGVTIKDGEIVAYECPNCPTGTIHARYYFRCGQSAKHDFRLATRDKYGSGDRFKDSDGINVIGPIILDNKEGAKEKPEAKGKPKTQTHYSGFEWSFYGIHDGDTITVAVTKDIKPGQLVLVRFKGAKSDDDSFFSRVCLVHQKTVRLVSETSNIEAEQFERPLSRVVGPVVKVEHGEGCAQKKIDALKDRIKEVRRNDWDSICDTTRLFELERELYALEHPKDEDVARSLAPSDDWPEVIEEYSPEEKMQAREASRLIRELVTKIYERDGEEGLKKLRQDVDEYFSVNSETGEGGGQQ
jgi:hypothetical protein